MRLRSRIFELVVCEGELLVKEVEDEPQSSSYSPCRRHCSSYRHSYWTPWHPITTTTLIYSLVTQWPWWSTLRLPPPTISTLTVEVELRDVSSSPPATSAPSTSLPPPHPSSYFINKVLDRGFVSSDLIEHMIRLPYTNFYQKFDQFLRGGKVVLGIYITLCDIPPPNKHCTTTI